MIFIIKLYIYYDVMIILKIDYYKLRFISLFLFKFIKFIFHFI